MSYCRRGYAFLGPEYASDVYVYASVDGTWVCDDCPRLRHHREPSPAAMAAHLREDRAAGFVVPDAALEDLDYDAEHGTVQGMDPEVCL